MRHRERLCDIEADVKKLQRAIDVYSEAIELLGRHPSKVRI